MGDNVTRMYRGIDPNDGSDSMFAVKNGRVASNWSNRVREDPEKFGQFEIWESKPEPGDDAILAALHTMELIWERDDSEAQA